MNSNWFEGAEESLRIAFLEEGVKRVNAQDFIVDYLIDNPPMVNEEDLAEFGTDEADRLAHSYVDSFIEWMRKNDNPWLKIGPRYSLEFKKHIRPTVESRERVAENVLPSFTNDEEELSRKKLSEITPEDMPVALSSFNKILSTGDEKLIAESSLRLALAADHKVDLPVSERVGYWEKAARYSSDAGFDNSYKWFLKAADILGMKMMHLESAKLYAKAGSEATRNDVANKKMLDIYRCCRRQYDLAGEGGEASIMFVKENDARLKCSSGRSKFILCLYKVLSNYGESPLFVAIWSVIVILLCALVYSCVGVDSSTSIDHVFSLPTTVYYSVVTFTTLGYGDLSPATSVGRAVSAVEAVCGLMLTSLFLVTVVRKFSR